MPFPIAGLWPAGLPWQWQVYQAMVACLLTFQTINLVAMLIWVVMSLRRKCRLRPRPVAEEVTVVVPAYLPNEAPILGGTIAHILTKLDFVEDLTLCVVYNTPEDMPKAEAELQAWTTAPLPSGRRVEVSRVQGSRSKAENLNAVLPQVSTKYVAIYDADHHPDPDSLALAVTYLEEHADVHCASGSTYIRQGPAWLRWFVHADFFNFFFVQFPVFQRISGTGFFTGSNGVWRASCFQDVAFDTAALTEDVDISIRGVLDHDLRIDFLPECRSGELTPTGLQGLWKQRLRWAMGWDQATLRYAPTFWRADAPLRLRLGLYYIFVGRWILRYCASAVFLISVSLLIEARIDPTFVVPGCIAALQKTVALANLVTFCCAMLEVAMHEPTCTMFLTLGAYYALLPFYTLAMAVLLTVSLSRVVTGRLGQWVVTDRPQDGPSHQGPAAYKLLMEGDPPCLLQQLGVELVTKV